MIPEHVVLRGVGSKELNSSLAPSPRESDTRWDELIRTWERDYWENSSATLSSNGYMVCTRLAKESCGKEVPVGYIALALCWRWSWWKTLYWKKTVSALSLPLTIQWLPACREVTPGSDLGKLEKLEKVEKALEIAHRFLNVAFFSRLFHKNKAISMFSYQLFTAVGLTPQLPPLPGGFFSKMSGS